MMIVSSVFSKNIIVIAYMNSVVTLHIPSMIETSEGSRVLEVCLALRVEEPTQRDFNISLMTNNDTGK